MSEEQKGASEEDRKTYREAHSLFRKEKFEAAAAKLKPLAEGKGALAAKARMLLADAHLAGKAFTDAEALLRAETERLLSAERRKDIAGIYLELAEAAVKPKQEGLELSSTADHDKALRLLEYLVEMELPADLEEEVYLRRARVALDGKQHYTARENFRAYLTRFDPQYRREILGEPDGTRDAARQGRHVVEARLGVAEAALRNEGAYPDPKVDEPSQAGEVEGWVITLVDNTLRHLEDGDFPKDGEIPEDALMRARWYRPLVAGLGREFDKDGSGANGPTAARRAVQYAADFLEAHPGTPEAVELMRLVPVALVTAGFPEEALETLRGYLDLELEFEDEEQARRLRRSRDLGRFAVAGLLMAMRRWEEAGTAFQAYLSEFPDGTHWQEAQEAVYQADAAGGLDALHEEDFPRCRESWQQVIARRGLHETTGWLALAVAYSHVHEARLAKKAEKPRKAKQLFTDALEELAAVARRYPGEVRNWAHHYRAEILRRELDDLEGAVREYRASGNSPSRSALSELEAVELALEVPRVYRAGEDAQVLLRTRNVEKVQVRRYRVNLADFFSKYHTTQNVARLDLDLVSPEETWEEEVPEYARYQDIEHGVSLKVEGAGAWAVTVEGKDFEATVLVLKSDLELVATTTHKEALVLVKDATENAACRGASVQVWGGPHPGQILELEAGDDGVARGKFTESPSEKPYVFATRGDHVAVSGIDLPGRTTVSLQPKGYIQPSRPVYLPGETAHVRGVIRTVRDGCYTIEEKAGYQVVLTAPDGRLIGEKRVSLSRFGTFTTRFRLPKAAALGEYSLRVRKQREPGGGHVSGGPVYNGRFEVQYVQPSKLFLELEPSRPAALAGDQVDLKVKAGFYTGAPLVGRAVALHLPDGRRLLLETDQEGRAEYKLDTTPFFRHSMLHVRGELPGEDAEAELALPLLPAACQLEVKLPSPKHTAGERLSVPVRLTTPDGEPVSGGKVEARVLARQTRGEPPLPSPIMQGAELDAAPGLGDEDRGVHSETLTTDEEGRAVLSLVLEDTGSHRLVFTAEDDEGRATTETRNLDVEKAPSPDLALEADSNRLRVGDEGSLRIRYKDTPGLGLVLFTGDGILDYQVHDYQKGVRALKFPVEPEHLPNVRVVALAAGEKRLHRAQQDLEVRRSLSVSVELPEDPLRPGEEIQAKLIARDERGAPVEADLCLSLIDKGLLDKHPDGTPHIVRFFEDGLRREVELTAASSVAFRRHGHKKEISKEVLEEEQRLRDEAAKMEEMPAMLDALECEELAYEECDDEMDMLMAGPGGGGMSKRMASMGAPAMAPMAQMSMAAPMPPPAPKSARRSRKKMKERADFDGFGDDEGGAPEEAAEREELAIGAVWIGSAVTGEDGTAVVSLDVPERTSAYRVMVRGAGEGDLFGEDRGEATVRRDLYAELKIPAHLFEGDSVRPVVSVQNAGDYTGPVEVTLSLEAGADSRSFPHTLEVTGKGAFEVVSGPFEVPAARKLTSRVEVKVAGKVVDALRRDVHVRPWGVEERAGGGGVLTDSRSVQLQLPSGVTPESARLAVTLHSPDPDWLLDDAPYFPLHELGQEVAGLRAMAWMAAAESLAGRSEVAGELERIRTRAMDALGGLLASQDDSGGWPWVACRAEVHQEANIGVTAWSLLALQKAHALGWLEDRGPIERAVQHLQGRSLDYRDRDERVALWALAASGGTDFSELNRRFRSRESLDSCSRALLGLAFQALDKGEYAEQLAGDVSGLDGNAPLLDLGLAVLLRNAACRRDDTSRKLEAALRDKILHTWNRSGAYWLGRYALATAAPLGGDGSRPDLEVKVLVGGKEVGVYEAHGRPETRIFELSGKKLGGLPVKLELQYKGRGAIAWRAELTGFTPKVEGKKGVKGTGLHSEYFYHSPRLYKGRKLRVSEMKVERVAGDDFVEDALSLISGRRDGDDPGPYTVLTRWIPGGLRLDRTSLPSNVLKVVEDRGRLALVYKGSPSSFRARLLPHCPGSYRSLGAELRSGTKPAVYDRLAGPRVMEVLAPGEKDDTPYAWTTSEHIAFGLAHFNDGEHQAALEHLGAVPRNTRDSNREVVKALLWIRCLDEYYVPAEVVDLFEVLGRKFSDVIVPYDKLLAVGRAYHDSGEDEAACLLWRSTLESSFRDDVPVAAELEDAGEYLRGVEYLESLFWEYPDLPTVAESLYGLSQDVYGHKDQREQVKGMRPHQVVKRAVDILNEFLFYFGGLPYADEATFSLLNALRELGAHEMCRDKAGRAIEKYPDGDYTDRFRYMRALAAFFLDDYENAVDAAKEVAGGYGPDSRTARFLLGQMYQALGRTDEALETYREVEHDFPDAARSIRYLERRALSMPEVATSALGETVEVELSYVGVTEVEVLAYKVDLMRLFLKERNLDRIAGVNLAGITPTCTFERELAAAPAGTTGTARIELPFEEVGAYLVLVRAQEAFASGLALVTPLHMETTRYDDGVRVTVLEEPDRDPMRDVYVKVSDGYSFRSGRSDLRGALTLPISGEQLTVVARRGDDEYAFHRAERREAAVEHFSIGGLEQVAYDQEIQATNLMVQQQASQQLRSKYGRRSKADKGVKAALLIK